MIREAENAQGADYAGDAEVIVVGALEPVARGKGEVGGGVDFGGGGGEGEAVEVEHAG